MTVNIISESIIFPNFFGGLHTAFVNHIAIMRKNKVKIKINSLGKADITHIHSLGPFALYKLLTSKNTVVSAHTIPETINGTFKGSDFWGNIFKKYLKFFYNKADVIIVFSSYLEKELKTFGVTGKMAIIPNPVDATLFRPDRQLRDQGRKKIGLNNSSIVILGAGHLVPRKGIKEFIEVANEMPNYTFIWAGDSYSSLLQTGIEKEFIEKELPANVIFQGRIAYEKMPELFNTVDIFFFPSYQETQGLVIVEAASCGLPLILRDLPEYHYLYDSSYVACQTNKQFKKAIQFLASDKKVFDQARKKSLLLAKNFSFESIGKKLIKCYFLKP